MKKLTFLFALLCASMMGFAAIDWDGIGWLPNSNEKYKLFISPNFGDQFGGKRVENGTNLWIGFPSAAFGDMSIAPNGGDGAWRTFALSNFPNKENVFTVVCEGTTYTFTVYYADGTEGGSTPDPVDPEPDPEPTPNSYTAGGHTISLDASYVDDIYTLVISSSDAMEGLGGSFWNVNGVGADMRTNAGTSSYTVSGDKKTITCQVQSSTAPNIYTPLYVMMPSEVNFGNVTLNWEDRTPIASEYCGQTMSSGNTLAKFTWETTEEGSVKITIIEALGGASDATHFRGNGINIDKITVGDSREAAETYFSLACGGSNTITLSLKDPANAPAPGTKIYVENKIIEYTTSKDGNAWPTLSFEYTYGGVCAEEKVLTEISLNAAAKFALVGEGVTLTAQPLDQMGMPIEAEVDFEISPADAGAIVGNVFTFAKTGAATITAKSGEIQKSITLYGVPSANLALNQICEAGYEDGNPAETAAKANDGDNNTAWVTYADKPASVEWWYVDLGAVYSLTGVNVLWGDPSSTSYKLFARTEAPSEEDKANDAAWEEIASVSGIGINSEQFNVVSVNARYVRVHSLTKSAGFLRMKEVSVFGTEFVPVEDTEKPVMTSASLESATFTEAVINVAATDNVGIYRFHVVDATNGIDANFAESAGKITITGLTHATSYNFTITAKDAAGNESENNKVVAVSTPFDGSVNLALNQPCEGGYYDNNPAETDDKANDGLENTQWTTYGDHAIELDWWVVDLGQIYNLTNITILWGDQYSTNYIVQARVEAPSVADKADDAAWVTLATVTDVVANAEKSTDVSGVGRYVRFRALAHTGFMRLKEFRVYGSGVAEVDAEKPVMSSASLVSNTDSRAIIAVTATDNVGIAKFHVVDAVNSFDANFAAEGGNITVTGLTGGTNYNFTITAIDFFGNESANSKSVEVTTVAHLTAPTTAAPAPEWDAELVKAIYSPTYEADCNFANWGGCVNYTQETYGKKYVIGDCGFFGVTDFSLNCLLMEKLHYDIWIADDATIRIVPIWGGTEQGKTVSLIGQQWNSIDLVLATDYNNVTNWSNIYQVKIDNAVNLTFWVANAYFYRETAYVDTEVPTNASASVASEGFYAVKINAQAEDNSGAVSFKVMNGEEVLATGAAATGVATTITVNNLTPGTNYNFNVVAYDEANNEAEPVVVVAETKFMPAAAPAPDFGNKKVVAVFTDAMACAVSDIHSGGWGETTQVEWLDIAEGDKVFYGQNFNYAGWHSWAGGNIDATGMQYLHVDIYSTGMTAVNVTPISAGREGVATINLTPNAWTSYDVPLSAYEANNIDWANIFQFKFMGPVGGNELMIDNVYFWSYQITPNAAQGTDAGGWATFASPVDLAVPAGMTAYKASYQKTETEEILNLTPISVIPANAGVILKGTAGEAYTFAPATEPAPDMSDNVLVGCVTRTDVSAVRANNDIFCMRYSGLYDFTGFFLYEGQYVPAGRAYLPLPKESNAPAAAQRRVRFVFNQEQVATGMENADTTVEAVKFIENGQLFIRRGEAVYSIQGVRVK